MTEINSIIRIAQHRVLAIRQDIEPLAALLPAPRGDKPAVAAARGVNHKTTGGYGYAVDADGIAAITITGVMTPLALASYFDPDEISVSDLLRNDVNHAAADPNVRGVIFRIDSPGGFVAGAYELADAICALTAKKPTAAWSSAICASAAYLAAACTNHVTAFRTAEIGSIGTRSAIYDLSEYFARFGVKAIPIDSGGMKSAGLAGTKITDEQVEYWRGLVVALNQHFVNAVASGRRIPLERAQELADGRVHVADDALKLKLIDSVGDEAGAMNELRRRIGASPNNNAGRSGKETSVSKDARPATIKELREAFPDDSAFSLDCAEKALTMTEAKAAFADLVLSGKRAATPNGKQVGNKGLSEAKHEWSRGGPDADGAIGEVNRRASEKMSRNKNLPRHDAMAQVFAEDDELRQAFNAEKIELRNAAIAERIRNATR